MRSDAANQEASLEGVTSLGTVVLPATSKSIKNMVDDCSMKVNETLRGLEDMLDGFVRRVDGQVELAVVRIPESTEYWSSDVSWILKEKIIKWLDRAGISGRYDLARMEHHLALIKEGQGHLNDAYLPILALGDFVDVTMHGSGDRIPYCGATYKNQTVAIVACDTLSSGRFILLVLKAAG